MDMVTYAALQKQIRESAGSGAGATPGVIYFSIDTANNDPHISCTFAELAEGCNNKKLLSFDYYGSNYVGFADSVSDSKIYIYAIEIYTNPIVRRISVTSDGKVKNESNDYLATTSKVNQMIEAELVYSSVAPVVLQSAFSDTFYLQADQGISHEQLFEALQNGITVRAYIMCIANPVLDQSFAGNFFVNEFYCDSNCSFCVFSFRYKGRNFELTIHDDETIEFVEVTNTTT